jgi:hypothetical protein
MHAPPSVKRTFQRAEKRICPLSIRAGFNSQLPRPFLYFWGGGKGMQRYKKGGGKTKSGGV